MSGQGPHYEYMYRCRNCTWEWRYLIDEGVRDKRVPNEASALIRDYAPMFRMHACWEGTHGVSDLIAAVVVPE